MALLDLLIYRDFDAGHESFRVGDSAAEKLGLGFEDLYVVAVGPGIHGGRQTVVLAHEHRPEMMQELRAFFAPSTQ
jgi:hypothetical protein